VAPDDVEEVDLARCDELVGDGEALLLRQAAFPVLVGDHPDADDEAGADCLAHAVEHP
jgi:hypothetical protein